MAAGRIFIGKGRSRYCLNSCPFCDSEASGDSEELQIQKELELAKRQVDNYALGGVTSINITGSDPCQLEDSLLELISYIYSKGCHVKSVQTHGRNFKNKELLVRMQSLGIPLNFPFFISLYGSTAELHNAIVIPKTGNAFTETIQGLMNCQELGIPLIGNTRILNENKTDIVNIIELFKTFKVSSVCVGKIVKNDKIAGASNEEYTSILAELTEKYPNFVIDIEV